ncbi:MAG: HAD-IA family hydrolase [Nitrospirota bacterium]|nr:HAD-IA family hydrolase [Nitrospirota bacterium]
MTRSIILDFDGVILESVNVKTKAFSTLFSDHPEHQQTIVDFHLKNGGMSRFDKFRIIYKDILKKPLSEDHFSYLCNRFEELVFNEVLKCDFVYGALEFLEQYKERLLLFVASATPHDEINRIVDTMGLRKYFKAVYGSPLPKNEAIEKIVSDFHLNKEDLFFVGDALNDMQAAQKANVNFIARDSGSCGAWSNGLTIIKDLTELSRHIT